VTMAARASFRVRNFLQRVVRKEQFDLVYACQLKTAIFIGQFPSCKRVVDFTDTVSLLYRRMLRFQPFFSRMYGFIEVQRLAFWERKIARLADLVLLVSPVDALALAKMAPEARISVIPNGVDTSYFQPLPCCERPVLTFWGNLRYVPNVDGVRWFCQEILPEIRKVIPDVELMIIGKDPSQEVIALSACPGVQVVGPVPDLRPYLAQTAVAVIPLRFGTGVRNKILEAFASARAVVSTSVGCEGLEVEPGVHLEVADEPEIFARKVIGLLQNPERRNQLAFSARILVEKNYTWEAVGERLREVVGRGKETRPW
ncbi:MAG: glycosyltransferase family 4 protein, partial [candidate division WOR-3 bacterium]